MKLKKAHSVSISPTDPFLKEFDRIDFHDAFVVEVKLDTFTDVQDVLDTLQNKSPAWIDWAMKLRNQVVQLIGLKTENSTDFIKKIPIDSTTVQLSGFDRHLDFSCLIQLNTSNSYQTVSLKTIVKTHNLTGKIYFGIVQHVHPKVVCSLLNSLSA